MKSSEYWQNRMNSIEQSRFESAFKAYKASEKAFTAAQRQLDQQIEVWINRIAVNNEVSYTEARKLLKGAELEEFKWDVEQYIAAGRENAVSQQWMKQLENASARSHISRLEAMKIELQQQIETAYGVQQSATADLLTQVYQDSYYHTAYEVQKGVGVGWEIGGVNEKALDRAVNGWATDEKSFSDRIWSNRTQMVNELQQQLTAQIATGAAPDDAIAALEKYVDSSVKSAKSKAGTLVMTESAAIGNAAQMDAYKELGVEEYEIVETLDSLTCSTCGAWDGQHFPIEEFQIGATAPPFHPNCRGCTAPWFDDDEEVDLVGERVARDENGDRYYVPGDMDYEEWEDKFVDGGDKWDLDVIQKNGTDTWKRAFKDVTDQYLKSAEPGNGLVLYDRGYRQSGHRNEVKTAEWLCGTFGGDVRLLKESNSDGVLTADYVWNGKLWEYKETSSVKALDKRLQHAIHQIQNNPGGVIIKISDSLAVKDIERQVMSRVRRSGIEAVDIMIVKGEKRSIEKIWRYKK